MASWFQTLFGSNAVLAKAKNLLTLNTTPSIPSYDWGTDRVVDTELTRGLYYNNLNRYSLSGFLCKPMINSNVSFIDKPEVQGGAAEFFKTLSIPYTEVHTMAERDADCFVWVQWDSLIKNTKFVIVPPEKVTERYIDPVTKEITGYKIEERFTYNDPSTGTVNVESTYIVGKNTVRHIFTSGIKSFDKTRTNPLGFVPIVQFSNNRESYEERGHSEIENILPQLKFYHDITFDAGHAQHTDGHPKISVEGVDDMEAWLDTNFGAGSADRAKNGESISMSTKDLFVSETGSVKYLQRGTPTGDYTRMSEIVFTQVVEGSETPEVNFGASMGTSLASVKEQRPVWVKKIERKQRQYSSGTDGQGWELAFKYAIKVYNYVTFSSLSEEFVLIWPKPDFKNELDNAEVLERMSNAIEKLKRDNAVGPEEIYDTLNQFEFLKLKGSVKDHEKDVAKNPKEEEKEPMDGEENPEEGQDGEN